MSEFINERITINKVKRDYYTDSDMKISLASSSVSNTVIPTDQVNPAGIPPTTGNYNILNNQSEAVTSETAKEPEPVEEAAIQNTNLSLSSYVRFYNLVPNGSNVSILINQTETENTIAPKTGTGYISLHPGIYVIDFCSDGKILYEYKFKALPGMFSTLALSESGSVYTVTDLSGPLPSCFHNTAYIRFAQLAMNAPAMDIYIDGIEVIAGILFGEVSAFIGVPSGVHNIKATASGTGMILVDKSENFPALSINDLLIYSENTRRYSFITIADENSCI